MHPMGFEINRLDIAPPERSPSLRRGPELKSLCGRGAGPVVEVPLAKSHLRREHPAGPLREVNRS